jgi:hypothetical protein
MAITAAGLVAPLTVLANVSALLIDIHELAKGLDDIQILLRPGDHELGALVEAVVQYLQCFQDMSPVLALVVQPLVEHVHDLVEFS